MTSLVKALNISKSSDIILRVQVDSVKELRLVYTKKFTVIIMQHNYAA